VARRVLARSALQHWMFLVGRILVMRQVPVRVGGMAWAWVIVEARRTNGIREVSFMGACFARIAEMGVLGVSKES
jgi:hypothetical protein